jgi:hypothetical protein
MHPRLAAASASVEYPVSIGVALGPLYWIQQAECQLDIMEASMATRIHLAILRGHGDAWDMWEAERLCETLPYELAAEQREAQRQRRIEKLALRAKRQYCWSPRRFRRGND